MTLFIEIDIKPYIEKYQIKGDEVQIFDTIDKILRQHLNENFIDMLDVNGIPYTDAEGLKRNDY